jgi:hypothetical protein
MTVHLTSLVEYFANKTGSIRSIYGPQDMFFSINLKEVGKIEDLMNSKTLYTMQKSSCG